MASNTFHAPVANTAAVCTIEASSALDTPQYKGISWSYDDTPTNGTIIVKSDTTEINKWYVTQGGPGFLPMPSIPKAAAGETLTITLSAGGGSVFGSIQLM